MEIHFFRPFTFDLCVALLGIPRSPQAEAGYMYWLRNFCALAQSFHRAQFRRHQTTVEAGFREEYGIGEGVEIAFEQQPAFERWVAQSSLLQHHADYQRHDAKISSLLTQTYTYFNTIPSMRPMSEIVEMIQHEQLTLRQSGLSVYAANAAWFAETTATTPEEIASLRAMEYKHYLWSDHWRAARAALILLQRCCCQAGDCMTVGDSWYASDRESEIHAHHMTYARLGHERYEDLVLLCKRHHDEWHQQAQFGTPAMVIVRERGYDD